MNKKCTDADFGSLSWHDCAVHGVAWNIDGGSGPSDLILDIDYICEWLCGADKVCKFEIAPADLVFHGITDLKMSVDWGDSGFQTCIEGGFPISEIKQERIKDQKVYLDRPYFKWTISFSEPTRKSLITFGATGFTQTLRKNPILTDRQYLAVKDRK